MAYPSRRAHGDHVHQEETSILKRRGKTLEYDWSRENSEEYLKNFFKDLKPGMFHSHSYFYDREQLTKIASEMGVKIKFFPYNSVVSNLIGEHSFIVLSVGQEEGETVFEFDPEEILT